MTVIQHPTLGDYDRALMVVRDVTRDDRLANMEAMLAEAMATGKVRQHGEDYNLADLEKVLRAALRRKRQTVSKWLWQECEASMRAGMIPASQAELGRWMMDWFIGRQHEHPDPRHIRKHSAPLFKELRGQK